MNIRHHILIGRDHARTIGDLAEALNVPRRSIEEAVQAARLDGVPIISTSDGLHLAQTPHEAHEWADRQRSRGITLMQTAKAVDAAGDAMDGRPLTLWDVA